MIITQSVEQSTQQVVSATFNAQLAVGAAMIAVCVVIHAIGLFGLQNLVEGENAKQRYSHLRPISINGTLFMLATVFGIIFVHFAEIWLFAFLYDYLGALRSFSDALYFSTISYATIGYSDASIDHQWRMVAAVEGILGVILLGWSTAFFVRILGRLQGDDGTRRASRPPRSPTDPTSDRDRRMIRAALRWLLGALYLFAGYAHLTDPAPFLSIMPAWVAWPGQVVYWTGLAEIAGALALLQPFGPLLRKAAGVGLALYALCVWPANINHMLIDLAKPDQGWGLAYHIPRMLAQPLLIWLALWTGGVMGTRNRRT